TVLRTYYGDANLDGGVNAIDFNVLATNYGKTGQTWSQGNFNYDAIGLVDSADFTLLSQNFNASPTLSAPSLGSLVPEPGSALLVAVAVVPLLWSRSRRRKQF